MLEQQTRVTVRPLTASDLGRADHIMRLAFGTFLGLPDPLAFMGDADYVRTRWSADPAAAFGADVDGELIGSNFATNWGSVGFFGPLTIDPRHWNQRYATPLLEAVMERFNDWNTRHAGLFTFAHSPKHIHLYGKFGFSPRYLTAIMSKAVTGLQPLSLSEAGWARYSRQSAMEQQQAREDCRELTDAIYDGLDLTHEIQVVDDQHLGDTLFLHGKGGLVGMAICHYGAGTEAGSGTCFVKFGAVRPGPTAARNFERLLDACEALAAQQGMHVLIAGTNLARRCTWQALINRGFQTDLQGVAMQRPDESGYNRPDVYLIDDWR